MDEVESVEFGVLAWTVVPSEEDTCFEQNEEQWSQGVSLKDSNAVSEYLSGFSDFEDDFDFGVEDL